jgi:dGTPase
MIDAQVTDLLAESARRIAAAAPAALEDVHAAPSLIAFTDTMKAENRSLKAFLRDHLYQHYQVLRMTAKARRIISDLFGAFVADPRLLPPQYQEMASAENIARATADYIAGMTDRYSMKEHRRLFSVGEL